MNKQPARYGLAAGNHIPLDDGAFVLMTEYEDLQNSVNEILEAAAELYAEKCEQLDVARQEVHKADNLARNIFHALEHYRAPLPICGHLESQALNKRRELFDYEVANPR